MKRLIMGVFALSMLSCGEDPNEDPTVSGTVNFGFNEIVDQAGRQLENNDDVAAILVSLEDESGNKVYELEELTVIRVGDGLFSETLELSAGNYQVVEFLVVNASNEALYIAPIEGSEKAKFVNDPLPVPIAVTANTLTTSMIEVLKVNAGDQPSDFGLINFELDLIDELDVIVSFFQEGLPVAGTLEVRGMVNDEELWDHEYEINNTPTLVELFKNVDEVRITARAGSEITRFYTIEELIDQPNLDFDFTNGPQDFTIEVKGVDLTLQRGLAILRGPSGVFETAFEINPGEFDLQVSFQDIPQDSYRFSISFLERGDFADPSVSSYTIHTGVEALGALEVGLSQPDLTVKGPHAEGEDFDLLPAWENRYFHTVSDELVESLTISFSHDPCEVDLRFLTSSRESQPQYMYIDYFLFNGAGEVNNLGVLECFSNCDPHAQFNQFTNEVVSDDERQFCEDYDWVFADSIIFFTYEDGHLLIFYQAWDENGPIFIPFWGEAVPNARAN